jgi:glycosyltransferase involved in cell wall biosynthesis
MPSITALLHTSNSGLQLGRALETLHPCDEILIVDHQSTDETLQVAREYGARIVQSLVVQNPAGVASNHYLQFASSDWILCLDPCESLTEALAASLYEFKLSTPSGVIAFSVGLKEETGNGWRDRAPASTRLIARQWKLWHGFLPAHVPGAPVLEGHILHFV